MFIQVPLRFNGVNSQANVQRIADGQSKSTLKSYPMLTSRNSNPWTLAKRNSAKKKHSLVHVVLNVWILIYDRHFYAVRHIQAISISVGLKWIHNCSKKENKEEERDN